MIKAVVFDLWNTLLTRTPSSPRRVLEILHIELSRDNMMLFERAVMTKEFNRFANFLDALKKAFNIGISVEEAQAIKEVTSATTINYFPDVKPALTVLKGKYKICLFSNTYAYVLERLDTSMFDYVFLSSEIGAIKPDIKAFKHVQKKLGLQPSEILMIGDSLPSDIEGALNAGWKAVHLDRRDHKTFKPRITSLEEVEKIIVEVNHD